MLILIKISRIPHGGNPPGSGNVVPWANDGSTTSKF